MLRAYLIDDEELALKRLSRMLAATGRVEVTGSSTDPVEALNCFIGDVLFLDIEMPGMNGFEFLQALDKEPLVIFTTAYSEYALKAFEVNSVDYLLKPIEPRHLERALNKLERIRGGAEPRPDLNDLVRRLTTALHYPDRLSSRTGERVEFIELSASLTSTPKTSSRSPPRLSRTTASIRPLPKSSRSSIRASSCAFIDQLSSMWTTFTSCTTGSAAGCFYA